MPKRILRYETRKKWIGFLCVVPWLIGFVEFFLIPVVTSIAMSVCKIHIENGPVFEFAGFEQYHYLFFNDSTFFTTMLQTAASAFGNVFLVILFSLFFATILVQNFRGRLLARAVFFLPVIVASGAVMRSITFGSSGSGQFELSVLKSVLMSANLSNDLVTTLVGMMESLFQIVWKCGIQILIFMAGLQSISPNIKEAAYVEGATGWEYFWKITFPLLMPMIQLNILYTIIDGFTDYSNPIIQRVYELNQNLDYEFSSTVSWTYFLFIFVLTAALYGLMTLRARRDG